MRVCSTPVCPALARPLCPHSRNDRALAQRADLASLNRMYSFSSKRNSRLKDIMTLRNTTITLCCKSTAVRPRRHESTRLVHEFGTLYQIIDVVHPLGGSFVPANSISQKQKSCGLIPKSGGKSSMSTNCTRRLTSQRRQR